MRPPGFGTSEKERSSKRSTSDSNKDDANAPPKKKNKPNKEDEESSNVQNKAMENVESDRVKMNEENEDDNNGSIEGQEDQVVRMEAAGLARGQGSSRTANALNWLELPTALLGAMIGQEYHTRSSMNWLPALPTALLGRMFGQGRRATADVNWVELPTAVVGRVLEWLSFTEGRHFFACNHCLWEEKRIEYESQMIHDLVLPGTPPCSFLRTLANVERLDFGPYCTNAILRFM